jgi:hypothetical protein
MKTGAWLVGATPNRYSLGPDPHVGLPAGGYLPKRVIGTYVKRKGGIPPQRQLQSIGSLDNLLEASGFEDIRIWAPEVPAQQVASFGAAVRTGVRAYNQALRLPPARFLLSRIGPLLHVVARRGSSAPTSVPPSVAASSSGADSAIVSTANARPAPPRD